MKGYGDFVPLSDDFSSDEVMLGTIMFVCWACNKLGLNTNPEIHISGALKGRGNPADFRVDENGHPSINVYFAQNSWEVLYYLTHELRHYWQYINLPDEFMYWGDPVRTFDTVNNPLEVDAWNFCGMDVHDPSTTCKPVNRTLDELRKLCAEMRNKIA